jgi:hypothetical protein
MRSRRPPPSNGLAYLAKPLLAAITAERTRVERKTAHSICGRYLGGLDEHPDVCWRSPGHDGAHL